MRSRELKTHTQNQFAFFHFTLHVQKHKAVTYLTPVLTTSMKIRIVNDFIFLQTTCVPVIIYLEGNASFQYHLGWFPKHLLKKISSRRSTEQLRGLPGTGDSMCRPRARQSGHLVSWLVAQRSLRGDSCQGSSCCCSVTRGPKEKATEDMA